MSSSLAGFEVIPYGRIEVIPEARGTVKPKTLSTGAACLRLNSAMRTRRRTRRNGLLVKPLGDDFLGRLVLLDVQFQDLVE